MKNSSDLGDNFPGPLVTARLSASHKDFKTETYPYLKIGFTKKNEKNRFYHKRERIIE